MSEARIYDQGYTPFRGKLASVHTRFLAIARNELRQAWKGKWFRRLVWMSFFPLVGFAVFAFVQTLLKAQGLAGFPFWTKFVEVELFLAMLCTYYIGQRAIGEDLRTGALTVYLSRPVDLRQYLLGKWLSIASGILAVTLLAGLILNLVVFLLDREVLSFLGRLAGLPLLAILPALSFGFAALGISSLVGRGRTAGIIWVVVYFVSAGLGEGLADGTGIVALRALSLQAAAELGKPLLEGTGFHLEHLWLVLGQLGWAALGGAIVLVRLWRWRGQ